VTLKRKASGYSPDEQHVIDVILGWTGYRVHVETKQKFQDDTVYTVHLCLPWMDVFRNDATLPGPVFEVHTSDLDDPHIIVAVFEQELDRMIGRIVRMQREIRGQFCQKQNEYLREKTRERHGA
jgi:hypothetical protein